MTIISLEYYYQQVSYIVYKIKQVNKINNIYLQYLALSWYDLGMKVTL